MFRIYIFLFFLILNFSGFTQTSINDSCAVRLTLVDTNTKELINCNLLLSTKTDKIYMEINNGKLDLSLKNNCDTLYIKPLNSVYQDTLLTSFDIYDTIHLNANIYEFEEIEIKSGNRRIKKYKLGEKNRKSSHFYTFQNMDEVKEFGVDTFKAKFVSPVLNNINKKLTINEMYVLLDRIPKDSIPNLYVSVYKNKNGKLGKPVAEKLKFDKIEQLFFLDNNMGWAKVIFSDEIIIPKEGFFMVFEKIDISSYSPHVAFMYVDEQLKLQSYSYVNKIGDGGFFPNTTVKVFIKATR